MTGSVINYELGYTPANLRELLKEKGITQKGLADLLGRDRATVSRWCKDVTHTRHCGMSHVDWLGLLGVLDKFDDVEIEGDAQ